MCSLQESSLSLGAGLCSCSEQTVVTPTAGAVIRQALKLPPFLLSAAAFLHALQGAEARSALATYTCEPGYLHKSQGQQGLKFGGVFFPPFLLTPTPLKVRFLIQWSRVGQVHI